MYTFLIVLLVITSVVIIGAVLLQAGKGTGLAATFGGTSSSSDSLIGTRQAGNLLTKISWWGGAFFLLLAFVLQIMSTRAQAPKSVFDQPLSTTPAPASAPTTPANAPALPLTAPATTPA